MKRSRKLMVAVMFCVMLFASFAAASTAKAKTVAKIGSKGYSSLQEAVSAAKAKQTIKIVANIKTTETVDLQFKNLTIDFQKKKYVYTYTGKEYGEVFQSLGSATFKNANIVSNTYICISTDSDHLTIESGSYSGIWEVNGKGSLTIKGGNFTHKKAGWLITNNSAKVVIKGGTFSGAGEGDFFIANTGSMSISGGKFETTAKVLLDSNCSGKKTATLNISGGTFTNKKKVNDSYAVSAIGNVKISGGSFYAQGTAVSLYGKKTQKAVISGGTFTYGFEDALRVSESANVTVNGGVFGCIDNYGGNITFNGGKSAEHIFCCAGGTVVINKFTIDQGKKPEQAMLLVTGEGSKVTVKGGTFKSPKGYLYSDNNGGRMILKINQKNCNVKEFFLENW